MREKGKVGEKKRRQKEAREGRGERKEREREGERSEGRGRMSFDLIPCDQLYSHTPKSLLPLPLKSPSSHTIQFLPGLLLVKAPTL